MMKSRKRRKNVEYACRMTFICGNRTNASRRAIRPPTGDRTPRTRRLDVFCLKFEFENSQIDVLRFPMLALSNSASPTEFVLGFPASDFLVPFPKAVVVAVVVVVVVLLVVVMISRACLDDDIPLHHDDMYVPCCNSRTYVRRPGPAQVINTCWRAFERPLA